MIVPKNKIVVGSLDDPLYVFENDQINSAPTVQAVSMVGQELSVDTFQPIVGYFKRNILRFRTSDGKELKLPDEGIFILDKEQESDSQSLVALADGTPLWYYHKGNLVGRFFITSVQRLSKDWFQLNSVSPIGRLDKMYNGGKLYTLSRFGIVLRDILAEGLHGTGDPVIEYSIDEDVAQLPVSGWLPYATKRNNLYQLILANGINIIKDINGNPRFTFIYPMADSLETIEDNRVIYGGSIDYTQTYSSVAVMEHSYTISAGAESVTLFDNEGKGAVSNEEIWFTNAPVIVNTLQTTSGLEIVSATENSAVISGSGKLTGVPYTHTARRVVMHNPNASSEKTVSVNDCTMVSIINSDNLLNRLFAFYCPETFIKLIKTDIIYNKERCGKAYEFRNPYGIMERAYLANMDIKVSSFNRASCEFYADYVPAGQMGLYKNFLVLDKETFEEDEGVFSVPEEVFLSEAPQIRVILISGGSGGGSGWPGYNGNDTFAHSHVSEGTDLSYMWYGAEGGKGGQGGQGGLPGRVLSITIQDPRRSYPYTIGSGGQGADSTGFQPDTLSELETALSNENPDKEYTPAELQDILEEELKLTDWDGTVKRGTAGSATTFGIYTTDSPDAEIPSSGVYNPLSDEIYALNGDPGIPGGDGGSRRVYINDENYTWHTEGESVFEGSIEYQGGITGDPQTDLAQYLGINAVVYGGNGAGAAIGIDKSTHPEINGDNPAHKLLIQYTYEDTVVGNLINTFPDGYNYKVKNIASRLNLDGHIRVFVAENQYTEGTTAIDDDTIVESEAFVALDQHSGILRINNVDGLEFNGGTLKITGEITPREVTISSSRSGRHNDPLKDTSYSYLPSQPVVPKSYGKGGAGGNGGGGGAGASTIIVYSNDSESLFTLQVNTIIQGHGYGSGGGKGGDGANGCILVFY